MGISLRKITTYVKNIVDLSDHPNDDGLDGDQLKAMFDGRTNEEIKVSINGIVDDLLAITDGASGADQIGATPITGGTAAKVQGILEELNTLKAADSAVVHKTGTETVAGVKTFSSSPVVPAPTTDLQAATKKYVDDAGAAKINTSAIVNDLTTGGATVPLSAEQGKTLQGEVGTLASLSTTEKGSLVGAINEVDDHADTNATSIGTLASLTTTEKTNLVGAINELDTDVGTNATAIGTLASLTTTEKTNLVGAINEVDADVGTNATAIGTLASLTTTEKTNLVGAINELDTDKVETSAITNTLTETAAGKVLDARQGKALADKIGAQTFTEDNYVTDGQSATASIDALDMAVKDNADEITDIKKVIGDTFVTSWKAVQEIVRQGEAAKYFTVGDQILANYNGAAFAWNIIGIDHDIPTDTDYTHSLTLQSHNCIMNCQWDPTEALYYCAAELPAGVHKFVDDTTTYEFTTTVALAIGSHIVPSAWTDETITQVKTYANASSTDVIETLAVTASTGAATLTPINDKLRTHYGSNEYINSAIRQFLNSTDTTFAWAAKTIYDRKPTAAPYTTGGFLNLLDADLVAVLGAVDKQVARNTVTDGGGQNTFSDKVFLLTTKEVYGANEGTITGEAAYAYYSALAGAALNSAMAGRIKYLAATARLWWLRSPGLTYSCYPRYVNTAGGVGSYGAYGAYGLAPACCIV